MQLVKSDNQNYLNAKKEAHLPKKVKVEIASKRKQNTYLRFTIAAVNPVDKDKKFLGDFKDTMTVITEVVDSRTIILPMSGVSQNHIKAVLDLQHITNTRYLARYIENLWIKGDQPTTFKLLLGHNKPTINFSFDQLIEKVVELGSKIKLCNIQSAKVSCVGWMIGSSPKQDTQLYAKLYNNHPKLMNYDIDCKIVLVKMTPSKRYTRETASRAMFIYTDKVSHKAVKKGLKNIYNKKRPPHHPSTDYPDGRAMKLVPGNFGLPTALLLTADQKLKFIQRKSIQIGVNKTFKNNGVRISGLLKADVQVEIDNLSVNGAKTADHDNQVKRRFQDSHDLRC